MTSFHILAICVTLLAANSLAALLGGDAILKFKPPKDKTDTGVEIDDLMPVGGAGDEEPDDAKRELEVEMRADYDKTLEELIPFLSTESRYAPHDDSYEHFAKKSEDEYTMEDVKEYELRNAIGADKRWPYGVVPYQVDNEIANNRKQQGQIYAAMKEWMEKTCITFQPYSSSLGRKLGHNQRIKMVANERGCWSKVGKQGEKWEVPQIVSLERNDASGSGCMHARVIMHELGHALGFHHEQTRTDRDKYVNVYMGNVQQSQLHNYDKVGSGYLQVSTPYDYLSIMQYGKDSFGKIVNGKALITMIPRASCYTKLIGKARHLSYYDHKLMNSIYGCNKGCDSSKCGANCYATKSGENKNCHCVCKDNSNNPCMGGSCFQGDTITNCAELISQSPDWTCTKYKNECCESCKGVTIDTRCDANVSQYTNCNSLISQYGKSRVCAQHGGYSNGCCKACL